MTKVTIPKTNIRERLIPIKGTNPLIVHRFGEKARKQILDIQNKSAKKDKTRDPEKEYLDCLYCLNGSEKTGFPAIGFKMAMVRAGKALGYVMTDLKGAIFVEPDNGELIEIKGDYHMRTDMVRVGNGGSDIRYRPEYTEWKAVLRIRYNAGVLSDESIAQLVQEAGFSVGIGEWRPQRNGIYGRWEIDA